MSRLATSVDWEEEWDTVDLDDLEFPGSDELPEPPPPKPPDIDLDMLVENLYEAWSEKGYRSIQCAGAVRKLCEAWGRTLG